MFHTGFSYQSMFKGALMVLWYLSCLLLHVRDFTTWWLSHFPNFLNGSQKMFLNWLCCCLLIRFFREIETEADEQLEIHGLVDLQFHFNRNFHDRPLTFLDKFISRFTLTSFFGLYANVIIVITICGLFCPSIWPPES